MNEFYTTLAYVNKIVYEANQLPIKAIEQEKQNFKYSAGTFTICPTTIRFRVANTTPTKVGQFVAFWEKDENNNNQPYCYEDAPDLLVINTFEQDNKFGQFIFPKEILLQQNILSSSSTKGRMAMRVYPSWDHPTSHQAKETQKWQSTYFIDMSSSDTLPKNRITEMYAL